MKIFSTCEFRKYIEEQKIFPKNLCIGLEPHWLIIIQGHQRFFQYGCNGKIKPIGIGPDFEKFTKISSGYIFEGKKTTRPTLVFRFQRKNFLEDFFMVFDSTASSECLASCMLTSVFDDKVFKLDLTECYGKGNVLIESSLFSKESFRLFTLEAFMLQSLVSKDHNTDLLTTPFYLPITPNTQDGGCSDD